MTLTLLWILAALLVIAGIAGVLVPALPGAPMVFAGLLLAAWIDGFQKIGVLTVAVLAVMTMVSWAVDLAAASLGAKRAGASGWALLGAALGTVLGIFGGLLGLLLFPLAGAMIGEYLARRDTLRAAHVGLATWLGLLVGTALKLALVFAMLGVFALAYFL